MCLYTREGGRVRESGIGIGRRFFSAWIRARLRRLTYRVNVIQRVNRTEQTSGYVYAAEKIHIREFKIEGKMPMKVKDILKPEGCHRREFSCLM